MSTTPESLSDHELRRQQWEARLVGSRDARGDSSTRYKRTLVRALASIVPKKLRILQIGCGTGDVLAALEPREAIGIEPSPSLLNLARQRHPQFEFRDGSMDRFRVEGTFDVILASDVLLDCYDVGSLLESIARCCDDHTRVVFTNYSQLWRPLLRLLRWLGVARPRFGNTWFSPADLRSALHLGGFEVIRESPEVLLPAQTPLLSALANRFLARLPLCRSFCLHRATIARKSPGPRRRDASVTVVVPARNESGNVARLLREIPAMGSFTEVIFVEGNSTDDTWDVLQRAIAERDDPNIRLLKQPGRGKGDAVRAAFEHARGDILMILDADLTVPAEMLPRFYDAVASGRAEFANGTRLVYPMDDRAMQFLNLLANHSFALAFSFVMGQTVRDTLCGTKALTRAAYAQIAANRDYFGDFDPFGDFDLLLGAARLNLRIADIPVRYRERVYGETNISRFRHGMVLIRMLGIAAMKLKFC